MTNKELIQNHHDDTMFCSMAHHMKSASTTYGDIIDKGEAIVPDILKFLIDNEDAGMSIMLLLWDITKTSPYSPKPMGGIWAYNVDAAKKAWIEWGKQKGLI